MAPSNGDRAGRPTAGIHRPPPPKKKPDCLLRGSPAVKVAGFNQGNHRQPEAIGVPSKSRFYLELVVVVDAETPAELVEAFAAQALRPMLTAADKANRVKNLMYFILL
jgi:hypothetical protein